MYLNGKEIRILRDPSKVPSRVGLMNLFCGKDEVLFKKNGASYNGHWTVKVTANKKKNELALTHEFSCNGSLTDAEFKKGHDAALVEAKTFFAEFGKDNK